MDLVELINKYGFPIVSVVGMSYLVFYVWTWVTREIKPVLKQTNDTVVRLIDKIRLLENDLIRLDEKVATTISIRGHNVGNVASSVDNKRVISNVENK